MLHLTIYFKRLALICGLVFALLYAITLALHPARAAQAVPAHSPNTTFVVTSTNNAGAGSLRRAILDANDNTGADTINFNLVGCPCVILLSNDLPTITDTVTIVGPGVDRLAVDGDDSFRVFDIDTVPATISDLTVQRGNTSGSGAGLRSTGAVTLTNVDVLSNTAQNIGGGAYVDGPLSVNDGQFRGNHSVANFGGGLSAYTLRLINTDVISNTSATAGGGAVIIAGTVISGGRFERNRCTNADCFGGGLVEFGLGPNLSLVLTDTVFVNNRSQDMAGGAYVHGAAALTGARFSNNHADANGGGLYVRETLTVSDTDFVDNTAAGDGGGAYFGAVALLNGGAFRRNQSDGIGGGLYVSGTVIMNNTQFVSNTADSGGGAHVMGGAALNNGYFERNQASTGVGGGLSAASLLIANNTDFISNTAADGGGAYAGGVWITGGRFERNSSTDNGGGLNASSLLLTGTLFVSNTANGYGGGLYTSGDAAFNQGQFEHNSSDQGGGGYVNCRLFSVNTTFYSNTAFSFGGGLVTKDETKVDHGWFENNHSDSDGGGIYAYMTITLSASTFIGNRSASGVGGGIAAGTGAGEGSVSIYDGWFESNHANHGGGIIAFDSATITETMFVSNTAVYGGGGAYLVGPFTITADSFIANQADEGGGLEGGSGLMINTLFARNIANVGTSLNMLASSVVVLAHSTIDGVDNLPAPGIAVDGGTLFASNTILAHHTIGIQNLGGAVVQDYNLFFANGLDVVGVFTGGVNSLIGDPRFLNPAANDYHLGLDSAAIDAGTNVGVAVDFENDARPQGPGFDIGYDEAGAVTRLYLPLVLR